MEIEKCPDPNSPNHSSHSLPNIINDSAEHIGSINDPNRALRTTKQIVDFHQNLQNKNQNDITPNQPITNRKNMEIVIPSKSTQTINHKKI